MLCRGRVCALGVLLTLYLAGVLLISTVTLDAQHKGSQGAGGRSRGIAVLGGGIRPPPRRNRLQWCQALRFLEEPGPVVALASFPGSGNTWVRYLLQQVTGIYTGSVYKDYGLLKNGFPAESVVNGSVSVVKTHEWGPAARRPFSKAVLLIRGPGPAIQAEFNRQSGGHIGFASPDRYRRNKGKYWQQFVADKLSSWRQTNLDWLHNFTGPMHVIFYDHLLEDVAVHLQDLLRFLKLNVSEQNLACALERQEGIYRRKRRVVNFDPFTTTMKQALQREQDVVYEAIANSLHRPEVTSTNMR
ncbi:WSCD family member AAEL009094 [Cryptotermes secundus]|uniref:WSCD family member protein n=1 Tax=Cryptotermes secundus TaxID=105785 RepID=A0A2J7RGN9_9NEOP|nr:WSCD family member AAEL009094 [Cryptotermes secundus]PNF40015.1 WSCD family member AAEL009094 [Cryptotermes secundus]